MTAKDGLRKMQKSKGRAQEKKRQRTSTTLVRGGTFRRGWGKILLESIKNAQQVVSSAAKGMSRPKGAKNMEKTRGEGSKLEKKEARGACQTGGREKLPC